MGQFDISKKLILLLINQICFWKRRKSNGLLIVTFHRISEEPESSDPLKVSLNMFEKQIAFLKNNYHLLSEEEFLYIINKNESLDDNYCMITFDDGWNDNYINAFPILKKYNVPALIFLCTDFIGTNRIFWHELLKNHLNYMIPKIDIKTRSKSFNVWPFHIANKFDRICNVNESKRHQLINELIIELKNYTPDMINKFIDELYSFTGYCHAEDKPTMLSWTQVKEMSKNNISFGSHARSHVILTKITADKVKEELIASKNTIEQNLGKPVYCLSYPNGNYNQNILNTAKATGYLAAFTCLPGRNINIQTPFELKRKHIREESSIGLSGGFSELFFQIDLSDIRRICKVNRNVQNYMILF
jgi:peptidoglycan/xylan/chitin deacetylase (PgdA/CDA1 family)